MKWLFILSVLLVNNVLAQVPADTSQKYKNVIDSLIIKEANQLIDDAQNDQYLFKMIFGPCTGGKMNNDDVYKMQSLFYDELNGRLEEKIQTIYSSPYDAYNYFGNKNKDLVTNYAKNAIGVIRKIGTHNKQLAKICNSLLPLPPKVNTPPIAKANSPKAITLPENSVTLDGSGSTDAENNIVSYQWQKFPGNKGDQILSSNSPKTKVTFQVAGNFYYILSVSDSFNASSQVTVTVNVNPEILPPTADAGRDTEIELPENTVTLSGSGHDPNGEGIIAYNWTKLNPAAGGQIVSPDNATTVVEGLVQGVYEFILTVTNKAKLNGSARVRITVNPRPNQKPVANAGKDTTITLPAHTIILKGSATDPDKDPLSFSWRKKNRSDHARIISPESAETEIEVLEEGKYEFILTANDGHQGLASDAVIVTVNAKPMLPPQARAGEDQHKKANETVTLTGSGVDDDTIVSFQWKMIPDTGKSHIESPSSDTTQVTGLEEGTYEFELTVTDNDSLTGTDTMLLKIDGLPPPPPKIPAWVWILIGVVMTGVLSFSYYIFWWGRLRKKLIVYFMNKEEEALAHELMPGHKKTEGYILGHSTQAKIKQMKKKGLALRILNTSVLTVHTPGATRTYKYSFKKGIAKLVSSSHESPGYNYVNIITDEKVIPINNNLVVPAGDAGMPKENELPAFYIITLDAPLLPDFRDQLKAIGLRVLQRVPFDSYIILVKESQQLDKLQHDENFRFIRMIKQYTAEDTGFTVRKDHFDSAGKPGPDGMLVVDLVLHREEDAPLVKDFLGINGMEQIASSGNTIRVRVTASNDIAYKLSSNKYIQAIYEHIPPVMHNDIARQLVGIDTPDGQVTAFEENGDGETIAVADTGIDKQHPDFSLHAINAVAWGRKTTNDTSDPHGHGTHVTGTIIGNGAASNGQIKGMAPGATIFFQSLLDDNEQLCDLKLQLPALLLEAYTHDARIMNISWGSATESYYTFDSAVIDQFVYDNQEMLVVISAGNEAANRKDINGNPLPGFGTVGSPATTKNGLTVGASNSKRNNGDAESMAVFSSRGPCRPERRIKPDIVAPGTNILSAKSSEAPDRNFDSFYTNPVYVFLAGTSMATPIVSGAAALVREYYKKKRAYAKPSAALIKATLLNGTHRLSGASAILGSDIIPNNNQGYGMLDMKMTIPNKQADFTLWFCDSLADKLLPFNEAGERRMFRLQVKQKSWLRVCMVFMDNPRMSVQSDLNLLIGLENTITKWKGNAGINVKDEFYSDKEEDFTNTIEIIRIDNAEPGSYLIEAVADNVAPAGNVGFAIVITTGDMTSDFSTVQP
jgi:serine protease AprX